MWFATCRQEAYFLSSQKNLLLFYVRNYLQMIELHRKISISRKCCGITYKGEPCFVQKWFAYLYRKQLILHNTFDKCVLLKLHNFPFYKVGKNSKWWWHSSFLKKNKKNCQSLLLLLQIENILLTISDPYLIPILQ